MQRTGAMAVGVALLLATVGWGNDKSGSKPVPKTAGIEYSVKLAIKGGHLAEVFLVCAAGATDGYDRELDDLAPPLGFGGVGYTFLVPPDRKMNHYRDVRPPADVTQWLFYGRPAKSPVELSWDPKELPAGLNFYAAKWDGKSKDVGTVIDMRKVTKVMLEKTGYVRIWTAKAK